MAVDFGLALDFWSTKKPMSQHLEDYTRLLKIAEDYGFQFRLGRRESADETAARAHAFTACWYWRRWRIVPPCAWAPASPY